MNRRLLFAASLLMLGLRVQGAAAQEGYVPGSENLQSRRQFSEARFGIFLHWGIYSMFGQGEWYMQDAGIDFREYAKAADGFYPHRFDARQWVSAIKDAGAKYICITSRHHDGFSMWNTQQSDYNIVKATPYGKDVIGMLADECHRQGLRLHLYYSHIDWSRNDYPWGRTGHNTGKDPAKADWPAYYAFMNRQLTELLSNYGPIGAIWFDGYWDHDQDEVPFNWQLAGQYELIHRLQPACLVANNHHVDPYPGEDIQLFERDLPGENTTGWSKASVSTLPLETCETMNGMWGYKVTDQNYKTADELIRLLVRTACKGANLLLNIGPQPDGQLPATALSRLKEMGQWMRQYGSSIYATEGGDMPEQPWGGVTKRDKTWFVHVLDPKTAELVLPAKVRVKRCVRFADRQPVRFAQLKDGLHLYPTAAAGEVDNVIQIEIR